MRILKETACEILFAGLEAVKPENIIPGKITVDGHRLIIFDTLYDLAPYEKIYVIGAGKASAHMAKAMENVLGPRIHAGLVITNYDNRVDSKRIEILEAAHPVPDLSGLAATQRLMALARQAGENDMVICLISGGASALLEALPEGINLKELKATTDLLLKSGANIEQINTVRKHVSLIKGGRLAEIIAPALCLSLVISDVPNDNPATIASGPTVADHSTFKEALEIIHKFGLTNRIPTSIAQYLQRGAEEQRPETVKIIDEKRNPYFIIANNTTALQASAQKAQALGFDVRLRKERISGEAREVAIKMVDEAIHFFETGGFPIKAFLFGGETTVTIKGKGRGGRNQEFVLAALEYMDQHWMKNFVFMSLATDGIDGFTNAAGALIANDSLLKAKEHGLEPAKYLKQNDSYSFFEKTNELIIMGPSGTNVMDIGIVLTADEEL